ncbi:carboxylating nicotinate-nucleotide diphosphorylase [Elongatibacter sediminis]|uniref:Probable nicotinate-nucleotide pyrophosphorylase [carboxylating] n=1 Tax=Elongatibacter sediminis TaxID=3119006 RepID=A0AAW9RK12_9GAMM
MRPQTEALINLALAEDAGLGDVTSESIFPADHRSAGFIDAREDLVVCGLEVAAEVFRRVDSDITVTAECADGDRVTAGTVVLRLEGPTVGLLTAERTALNFLQRLCGVATQARRYADAADAAGTGVRVVDTRKTTPGWRGLEKYAVRCGGCGNHRFSLGEHVLIKDNHIAAAGSLAEAVRRVSAAAPHTARIEVEAATLDQVREALSAGADVVLLDNMQAADITAAVELIDRRALVEVSGGIDLDNLAQHALPGVDVISVGALTHSVTAADLGMSLSGTKPD